jgi:DNA-binding NarL/FixJ family response regulator
MYAEFALSLGGMPSRDIPRSVRTLSRLHYVPDPEPSVGRTPGPDFSARPSSDAGQPPSANRSSGAGQSLGADQAPAASQAPGPDPRDSRQAQAEQAWLFTAADQAERRLAQVAALGQTAQMSLGLGQASACLAALAEQRSVAGHDQASLVWALTTGAGCRAVLGQLRRARADLTEARQNCQNAAPLLAEPFWHLAAVVCNWMAGDWSAALDEAELLNARHVSSVTSALAGAVVALRADMLRGVGLQQQSQSFAGPLKAALPAEISAWALAGLEVDQGQPATALRHLADARDAGERSVNKAALPLVLHRMAEIAFSCGNRRVTAQAAADLAALDQVAPLTAILTRLAESYATGDARPARCAQQLAEAEGARTLAAEALTVRGLIGDAPATTLAAAHAAWRRIGAPAKARAVAAAMHSVGLPAPAAEDDQWSPRISADGPSADGALSLTARERSLARLVHEGRTNQQIASTLHISVKTVEAYLTRLYRKTSCASRVELAVAVTERRVEVSD